MPNRKSDPAYKYRTPVRYHGIPNPLRHFRGRGIHSPFAYALVRNVFMRRRLQDDDRTLYDALRSHGAGCRAAAELQNLFTYCGYGDFRICGKESGGRESYFKNVDNSNKLLVLTPCVRQEELLYLVNEAKSAGNFDVCLLRPGSCSGRLTFCRDVALRHKGMSVENRRMIVLFNRQGLNEEHIKL